MGPGGVSDPGAVPVSITEFGSVDGNVVLNSSGRVVPPLRKSMWANFVYVLQHQDVRDDFMHILRRS